MTAERVSLVLDLGSQLAGQVTLANLGGRRRPSKRVGPRQKGKKDRRGEAGHGNLEGKHGKGQLGDSARPHAISTPECFDRKSGSQRRRME